jgi:ribonuclease HI
MVHIDFKATNNRAEYEALLFGLSKTLSLGVRQVIVKGDSQVIIKPVKGNYCCNDPQLAAYLLHARKLEKDFELLNLQHIPRVGNAITDDLSTKASTSAPVSDGVLERHLRQPISQAGNPGEGGQDQHLEASGLSGPATMEPAKGRRRHERLRASQHVRSRSSS